MHSMRSRRIFAQSVRALEASTEKKNSNDTRSPGMTAVAHNRMHENTIAIIRAFAAEIFFLQPRFSLSDNRPLCASHQRITDELAGISYSLCVSSKMSLNSRVW